MSLQKKLIAAAKSKITDPLKDVPEVTDSLSPYSLITLLTFHSSNVYCLLTVDEHRFISLSVDSTAVVWDIRTGKHTKVFRHDDNSYFVCGIVIQEPNSLDRSLVAASSDRIIRFYSLCTGTCITTTSQSQSYARYLLYIEKDDVICAAGNHICLYNRNGNLLTFIEPYFPEDIWGVIEISTSRLVMRADNGLYVYKLNTYITEKLSYTVELTKKLAPHRDSITVLSILSENYFVSASIDGLIILWRSADMLPTHYFNSFKHYIGEEKDYPHSVQFICSIDQRFLAAAIGRGFSIYDAIEGKTLLLMEDCHHSKVSHIELVWNNLILATCSEDGTIRLWGLPNVLANPMTYDSALGTLCGISEGDPPLWKRDKKPLTLELLGECAAHTGNVKMLLDFGERGIVSCGLDSYIIIWKNAEIESALQMKCLKELVLESQDV